MTRPENATSRNSQLPIIYSLISLLALVEGYFLANIVPPPFLQNAHKIFFPNSAATIQFALVFFIVLYFCLKKQRFSLREKPEIIYLLLHTLLVIFFFVAGSSKSLTHFIVKFNLLSLLFITFHFTLILAFLSCENPYLAYLISFGSVYIILVNIFTHFTFLLLTQTIIARNASKVVYLLLRISGFHAFFGYIPAERVPVIGTDLFKATVYPGCSGVEGISMFAGSLILIVYLNWEKINKIKAVVVGISGAFAMHFVNIFRIYLLILIGHFFHPETAIALWHSYGSAIFYALTIVLMLKMAYKWMVGISSMESK